VWLVHVGQKTKHTVKFVLIHIGSNDGKKLVAYYLYSSMELQ